MRFLRAAFGAVMLLGLAGCESASDRAEEARQLDRIAAGVAMRTRAREAEAAPTAPLVPACQLQVVDFSTELEGNFVKTWQLSLKVKNLSPQRVRAWKATLIISNAFGAEILSTHVEESSTPIAPGKTATSHFGLRDNPYIHDDPFDRVSVQSRENMTMRLDACDLVFGAAKP